MEPIFVVGAAGKVGRTLVARLAARGVPVVAIGRSRGALAALPAAKVQVADLADRSAMTAALAGARLIASCVHARFVPQLLHAVPSTLERLVVMGSTRKFTRFPDQAAEDVRRGEEALVHSGLPGIMIHPTMIYGSSGENNVQRIAAYIKRCGIVPLPRGGRALLQPIYIDDVAACLDAALTRVEAAGPPLVVAGPNAVSYREIVKLIGKTIHRHVRIVSFPFPLLMAAAVATRFLPMVPRVTVAEVRRLLEDKVFDISEMRNRLAVEPIGIEEGLARTLNG